MQFMTRFRLMSEVISINLAALLHYLIYLRHSKNKILTFGVIWVQVDDIECGVVDASERNILYAAAI